MEGTDVIDLGVKSGGFGLSIQDYNQYRLEEEFKKKVRSVAEFKLCEEMVEDEVIYEKERYAYDFSYNHTANDPLFDYNGKEAIGQYSPREFEKSTSVQNNIENYCNKYGLSEEELFSSTSFKSNWMAANEKVRKREYALEAWLDSIRNEMGFVGVNLTIYGAEISQYGPLYTPLSAGMTLLGVVLQGVSGLINYKTALEGKTLYSTELSNSERVGRGFAGLTTFGMFYFQKDVISNAFSKFTQVPENLNQTENNADFFVDPDGNIIPNSNKTLLSTEELKNIGSQGNNSGIREVKGTVQDAQHLFAQQVDPLTVKEVRPGVYVGQGYDGYTYTFRSVSSNASKGVPTIDIIGIQGLRKIKFIP